MWEDAKETRLRELLDADARSMLSDPERAELGELVKERMQSEEDALRQATRKVEDESADLLARVQQVESQNRELERLVKEQEAYLTQVQAIVADMEARRRRWRERYAQVIGRPLADPVGNPR